MIDRPLGVTSALSAVSSALPPQLALSGGPQRYMARKLSHQRITYGMLLFLLNSIYRFALSVVLLLPGLTPVSLVDPPLTIVFRSAQCYLCLMPPVAIGWG